MADSGTAASSCQDGSWGHQPGRKTRVELTSRQVGSPYGYLWWLSTKGMHFADGYGGQYVFVMPSREMVMAVTTTMPRNSAHSLIPRFVVPAILD